MKKLQIFSAPIAIGTLLLSFSSCQSMGGHVGIGMGVIGAIFVIALGLFVASKMIGRK